MTTVIHRGRIRENRSFTQLVQRLTDEDPEALARVLAAPPEQWDPDHYFNRFTGHRCLVGHLGDYGRGKQLPGYEYSLDAMHRLSYLFVELCQRFREHDVIVALQDEVRRTLKERPE